MMQWISLALAALAAMAGFVAAWRWYQSSQVQPDPGWGLPGSGRGHEPSDQSAQAIAWAMATISAFDKASRLNRVAALWTASSVFLSALSAIIESWPGPSHQNADRSDIIGQASVIDGDTIEIHGQPIRLMGIDAPESGQTCGDAEGAKYMCGQRASFFLADMLKDKTVRCADSGERSYKRVLAHCFADGVDVQREMVRAGWAIAYRRYSQDYVGDEAQAEAAKRGIWIGPFVEPEAWRHDKTARN